MAAAAAAGLQLEANLGASEHGQFHSRIESPDRNPSSCNDDNGLAEDSHTDKGSSASFSFRRVCFKKRSSTSSALRRTTIGVVGAKKNSLRELGEVGRALAGRGIGGRTLSNFRVHPTSPTRSPTSGFSDAATASAVAKRRATKPWYIVDPRRSRCMAVWDVTTTVCLLFTATVTPYEVAILEPPPSWETAAVDPLFLLNRIVSDALASLLMIHTYTHARGGGGVASTLPPRTRSRPVGARALEPASSHPGCARAQIDLVFFSDLCLNFVLMIQSYDDREGVKWIDEPKVIVRSYLRGWFALDLLSIIPSAFDMVPLSAAGEGGGTSRWRQCGAFRCLNTQQEQEGSIIARFKAFRVIRVCRLIKLIRLLRASRMLKRWETRVSINYASLTLGRCVVLYLIAAHWAACLLLLPTTFFETPMLTWIGYYGYCVFEPRSVSDVFERIGAEPLAPFTASEAEEAACTDARGLHSRAALAMDLLKHGTCSVRCSGPGDLYMASAYMSLQVISGTSGGEFANEVYSTAERCVFCLIVVVGALLWGHVIGTFVTVISQYNPDLTWFRTTMDSLNRFMAINQLPPEMRVRLREFFQQSRHVHRGQQRRQLLQLMSPLLQGEVALAINEKWVERVRFLKGAEKELVVLVAISLSPTVFAPGEMATPGYLYIVHKGVALYGGRVLTSGAVWGQDMILRRQMLCRHSARAISYLEVFRISRSQVRSISPSSRRHLAAISPPSPRHLLAISSRSPRRLPISHRSRSRSRAQLLDLARPFPIAWSKIRWEAFRLALLRTVVFTREAEKQAAYTRAIKEEGGSRAEGSPDDAAAAPSAAPAAKGLKAAGKALKATKATKAWTGFIESASSKSGDGKRRPGEVVTPMLNPMATEDPPSMHHIAGGLEKVRDDVARVSSAVEELKAMIADLAPKAAA